MFETMLSAAYGVVGVVLTVLAAWLLERTGKVMLAAAYEQRRELVERVTRTLVMSFSVVMLGFLLMAADFFPGTVNTNYERNQEVTHFGGLLLFLGVNLFFHLFLLSQMRGRARRRVHHGESILT